MQLDQRIELLEQLADHMTNSPEWRQVKESAYAENAWFVPDFIELASFNIIKTYLDPDKLRTWINQYPLPAKNPAKKKVGLVMAGNIPLVGFHDFLCGFLSGHQLVVKPSAKDSVLIKHLVSKLAEWNDSVNDQVVFAERLIGCDAYIATGSNNSGRYFEYYFRNYPSIIRKNRTSTAILTGLESPADLDNLADDILLYFGLGCRNVSKIYIPKGYDFIPLLNSLDKYKWMEDHSKFKNNYDYNLSLHILNHQYYMTNGVVIMVENPSLFSPISQLHFEFYEEKPPANLPEQFGDQLQCIVGTGYIPFGSAQSPGLEEYADGVDTMRFFSGL